MLYFFLLLFYACLHLVMLLQNFEFHGVIRFYHQDSSNDGKYSTKCVRVSNTATTVDVIETLSEKFRSDMRMLTKPNYALFEVHVNGGKNFIRDV